MTQKIAIWVCSNAALDYVQHPEGIKVLRSTILFSKENESLEDFTGIKANEFYNHLKEHPQDIPKTAYVSYGRVEEYVEEAIKEGVTDVIAILISGELSGLVDFFVNIKDAYIPLKIHTFDSRSLAYVEAYMAIRAKELSNEGKTVEEILPVLEHIRDTNHLTFTVETLDYLVLNGRLSKKSAMLGNLVNIRPVMHLHEGKVIPLEKARTKKGAIKRMLQIYFEEAKDRELISYIAHANAPDEAENIKKIILEHTVGRKVIISPLTPVVGAHCGPGAIGIGFFEDK